MKFSTFKSQRKHAQHEVSQQDYLFIFRGILEEADRISSDMSDQTVEAQLKPENLKTINVNTLKNLKQFYNSEDSECCKQ